MASPSSTFTEMVTTTLRHTKKNVADNVSKNNALYNRLEKKKKIKKLSGGYEIQVPLDYAENSTYQRYSGFDTLDISASDVLTSAKYDWVQAAVHVVASGSELRKNSGEDAMINLAQARVKNALRTAANNMSTDLYSSGSLSNQMGGLGLIIQNDGTGTVGGINSSTWTFWKNKYREATGTNALTSSNIVAEMNALYLDLVRGTDKPDLIVSTHDLFALYWASQQQLQRYASEEMATTGFRSLKFVDADVIFDSNDTNFTTTGEKMYFLNTDYLELNVHKDANWDVQEEKVSVNQDGVVIPIIWMGQLVCSNRAMQGVLIDAS